MIERSVLRQRLGLNGSRVMFRIRNPAPTEASSRLLAGFLACIAGFVNSAGFLLIGTFTSHVTGNVGRLANDIAAFDLGAAAAALLMIFAFFFGAFLASSVVESGFFTQRERAVALVLLLEAALLGLFVAAAHLRFFSVRPRGMDLNAGVLCTAMGMQNSLITRLSGATVRTTHLTGVMTDLGIEAAHWWRWRRARAGLLWPAPPGSSASVRPDVRKLTLLLIIAGAFTFGAAVGASAALRLHRNVMAFPALGLIACALHALREAASRSREARSQTS